MDEKDNIVRLALDGKNITLIGTAHISKESVGEVEETIRAEQPGVVCIELDEGRFKQLSGQNKGDWEKLDIIKVLRSGKGFFLLANLVLSSFQRRMGESLDTKPGAEMQAAAKTAEEIGVPYAFCDREIEKTLNRAWRNCGFWSKCKLLASLCASAFSREKLSEDEIENLKKSSELDGMMEQLAEYLPEVKETLIDERDKYLAAKIWENTVTSSVAVVGAGHLPGIQKNLKAIAAGEESDDVTELTTMPPPSMLSKSLPWLIPVIIVALIAIGFLRYGAAVSGGMVLRWVLWNGSLAAAGALLALAHPLAIIVSFVGAPIGTISPVLSIGLFSGVVQALVCKPRVEDFEHLSDSITSVKGVYQNRITRCLLVFFLSSLGGAIGNIISVPALAAKLL